MFLALWAGWVCDNITWLIGLAGRFDQVRVWGNTLITIPAQHVIDVVRKNYLTVPEAGDLLGTCEEDVTMKQLTLSDKG